MDDAGVRQDKKAQQQDLPTGTHAAFVHAGALSG